MDDHLGASPLSPSSPVLSYLLLFSLFSRRRRLPHLRRRRRSHLAFDSLCQDRKDDIKIGVHSTAVVFRI